MKGPMKGFLERSGFGAIPTSPNNFRGPTGGINGVIANVNWGDIQKVQPGAYPSFTASVGSSTFNADRNLIENSTSGTGSYAAILNNINGVETGFWNGASVPAQALVAGSQVKIRMFAGVGAVHSFTNPPSPAWLTSLCGHFVANDQTHGLPYWVNGATLASLYPSTGGAQSSGDLVCSPINGLQYVAQSTIASGANTVDPSVAGLPKWQILNPGAGAPGYGAGAGPVVRWFGPGAASYLAAYTYFQLLLANARLFVSNPTYTNPGDGGTWFSGGLPQTIGGVTYTTSNSKQFTLDTCPMIGEVTQSSCTTVYGEPCIRQISGFPKQQYQTPTNNSFIAAGYTCASGLAAGHSFYNGSPSSLGSGSLNPFNPAPDSDIGQILACQAACAAAWQNTCISEANNPFQIQGGADVTASTTNISITDALIAGLINACVPGQALPGNNSVQGDTGNDGGILAHVAWLGAPIYFQTDIVGNFKGNSVADVIAETEAVGTYNLELPTGNYTYGGSPTNAAGLYALSQAHLAYIANGTGPAGVVTTFPDGTTLHSNVAYAPANTRTQTGGPVWTAISPPTSASVGVAYGTAGAGYTVAATGTGNTYTVTTGALPTPMTLNPTSGLISGTPNTAGPYSFVITVTNSIGQNSSSGTLSITVASSAGAPVIVNADPPDGVLGVPYGPGGAGYQFTVVNPSGVTWGPGGLAGLTGFPLGLTLSSSGLLSGTPIGVPMGWTCAAAATNGSLQTTKTGTITINIADPNTVAPTDAVLAGTSTTYSRFGS